MEAKLEQQNLPKHGKYNLDLQPLQGMVFCILRIHKISKPQLFKPHETDDIMHTPSIVFWDHLPNSARIGYATEGALFIFAQLSPNNICAHWKVWVLMQLWMSKHAHKHEARPSQVTKKWHLSSDGFVSVCAGISDVDSYKIKKSMI